MTKYFEVTRRDASARLGRLILNKLYTTPLILEAGSDNPIVYAGNLWARNTLSLDDVDCDKLVILPDKPVPLHTRQEQVYMIMRSARQARRAWDDWNGALGRIIHPVTLKIDPADLYVVCGARQFENNARALVDTVISIKNYTQPDSALYTPALATPENLAMLIYLGIDIVDDVLPVIRAFNDIYMTPFGEYRFSTLRELPCRCSVCSHTTIELITQLDALDRKELIARHNKNKLEEEKLVAIQHINNGNLREYIEGKCRSSSWLTALVRFMDLEYSYQEQRTPTYRNRTMYANSSESLHRVEVIRFAQRIKHRYQIPDANILLLLPCSARKPYSISRSHRLFSHAIGKNRRALNEVIITSPLGIVPRELEIVYPAAHYDIPVTGYWDHEELKWVIECLTDYLRSFNYSHIIAHIDGAYKDICQSVAQRLDKDIIYTASGSVTSDRSLDTLGSTINNIVKTQGYELKKTAIIKQNLLRAIADYQFGRGAGDILVPENAIIKAPFPKYRIFDEKEQLASIDPETGILIPTLHGAKHLLDLGTYQVRIDDFIPKGSLLAPGVIDANPDIRPSDQVIVVGERVLGIGRALMSGEEMVRSNRGAAVDLRQVEEI